MKMSKAEKQDRKELITEMQSRDGFMFRDYMGNTFAFVPEFLGARTGIFAAAILNPRDKFRRKYGEYLALTRAINSYEGIILTEETVRELRAVVA